MFGLGVWEFALILVVALLVLGPERLPKVARTLGRGMRELRKAMNDFQTNLASVDIDQQRERTKNRFPAPSPPPPSSSPSAPQTDSSGGTFVPSESNIYADDDSSKNADAPAPAAEEKREEGPATGPDEGPGPE